MKRLLILGALTTFAFSCSVCEEIDKCKVVVESTYKRSLIAKKYHGAKSQEYKLAVAKNKKAWKALGKAKKLPVSHRKDN